MQKIPKIYYIIAIILGIYLIGIFLFQQQSHKKKNDKETIVMVGLDTKLVYKINEWNNLSPYTAEYDWKKFDIYQNGFLENKYMIENRNGAIYYYDDGYVNLGVLNDSLIAVKSEENYHIIAKNESTLDKENQFVKQVLLENNINSIDDISDYKMLSVDLNNDGVKENIYYISNLFLGRGNKFFSIVFSIINDKIVYITKRVENNIYADSNVETRPTISDGILQFVFNIDGTDCYDVFINNSYYGRSESCMEIYRFEKNEFKRIRSCGEE